MPADRCQDGSVEPERDGRRELRRRFSPWGWFWLWCTAGAAAALAIGGTGGTVFLALFATAALFHFAVIARIEHPPPDPPHPEVPDAASAPLVFVLRGRSGLFASRRIAAMGVTVELEGEETWSLEALQWDRVYAVRIPTGEYRLCLRDARGRSGVVVEKALSVTLIPEGRLYVQYRRTWSLLPRGSVTWAPSVPDDVAVDEVINAKKERN